jgi:hypothetical protein
MDSASFHNYARHFNSSYRSVQMACENNCSEPPEASNCSLFAVIFDKQARRVNISPQIMTGETPHE